MVITCEKEIASKLLEAAVRLFALKGYPATSTREIVEAAGVTKPMLYYYFHSKEGILAAALAHFLDPLHARLDQVLSRADDPRERLVQLVWAHLDFCRANKPLARLFFALYFGPDDQKHVVDLSKYTQTTSDSISQSVRLASEAGLIRPGCEDDLIVALHGMIHIWVIAAVNDEAELDFPLAARIVDNLLRGYRRD
jgi:AcrR family transcriptional regulator